MGSEWWVYENLESGYPYDWKPAKKGDHPHDDIDFHIDLGGGRIPKGRLNIDRHGDDPDILMDLNTLQVYKFGPDESWVSGKMPFPDESIESIISHHCLEHIGDGFLRLMDECYRILKPSGIFRIITPLFPSIDSVTDPDHKRYFTHSTFVAFCHHAGEDTPFWTDTFAEPYTASRFWCTDIRISPPNVLELQIDNEILADQTSISFDTDMIWPKSREIRVTLQKPPNTEEPVDFSGSPEYFE